MLRHLTKNDIRDLESCTCPSCLSAGPRPSPLRRMKFGCHRASTRIFGVGDAPAPAPRTDDIATPDLRAAVEARHAVTSKNVVGWRKDQRPPVAGPPRPAGSPFEDSMAREVFDLGPLMETPDSAVLKTAIDNANKARSKR
jgi:hypothetical protein